MSSTSAAAPVPPWSRWPVSSAPRGPSPGVDADLDAVDRANAMIAAEGLVRASARVGQADATGLDSAAYDVAVLRHVLAHNGDREQTIVDHLATLIRPGGCV